MTGHRINMYIKEADVATTRLRFEVARVECNCAGGWEAGTINKQQSNFPPGTFAPYQVRLDNGKVIYAPKDEDGACRAYTDEAAPVDGEDFQNAKAALEASLQKFTCTSKYASGGVKAALPKVVVNGDSPIELAFPLTKEQEQAIINLSSRSPVGTATEDLVELSVRKSWELLPHEFTIANQAEWATAVLVPILRELADTFALGGDGWQLGAELYKLLVYEKGCFFARHRDNERIKHMWGTLVITLPSVYSGAVLHVHSPTKPGDSLSFAHFSKEAAARATRSTAAAPSGVQWAAFYADCYHEVDELTAGSRVALVYNLTGKPSPKHEQNRLLDVNQWRVAPCRMLTAPPQPADEQAVATIAAAIRRWEGEGDADYPDHEGTGRGYWGGAVEHTKPSKLVAVLSHSYTPHSICKGLIGLKGRDRVVGELLAAASKCKLDAHKAPSLKGLCVDTLLKSGTDEYKALDAHTAASEAVQSVLDEQGRQADAAQPVAIFDAYLAMVVLWDRGECTPDNPYFTTGPLIPLTDQSPDFIASSQSASNAHWEPGMFSGGGEGNDEVDIEDFVDEYGVLDEEAFEEACSAGPMMREPGQLRDDLIIKADELLLTDKQSKEDVHTGDHLDTVEKMEFLGNGCPYPGMWCDTVVTLSKYDTPVEIV